MEMEKEIAVRRFRKLRQIGRLLRLLELAGALLLLSYSSAYLPSIARNSGIFLRRVAVVLISPTFVFLFGNAIVLVLFAKSGHIASSTESSALSGLDGSDGICSDLSYPSPPHLGGAEEVVYEDKEVCMENRASLRSRSQELEIVKEEPEIQRTKAEDRDQLPLLKLPSPAADVEVKCVAVQDRGDAEALEDAEQFRRTVEEFIAKQQRFQRQESLSGVSYSARLPEPVAV